MEKVNKVSSRLVGFIRGANYVDGKFVMKKIGDKGAGLSFSVSSKDKDGNREYGLDIPLVVWMNDAKAEAPKLKKLIENMVVVEGYYKPNNYTKDGKVVKGNQFVANFSDVYSVEDYAKKSGSVNNTSNKAEETEDDELPF